MEYGIKLVKDLSKKRGGKLELDSLNPYKVNIRSAEHLDTIYFGTKVYKNECQLVDSDFTYDIFLQAYVHDVCNGKRVILFSNKIEFHSQNEIMTVLFDKNMRLVCESEMKLHCDNDIVVIATPNGVAIHSNILNSSLNMKIQTTKPYPKLRYNDRYCAWMKQDFVPYTYISALYGKNCNGKFCPLECFIKKENDFSFELEWHGTEKIIESLIEINFHEEKLFQDTTVESSAPNQNNVYGASAFVGNTDRYGTQWLFSKTTFPILDDLHDKRIERVIWHIPMLNKATSNALCLYATERRFCSFGTTWINRVAEKKQLPIYFIMQENGYLSADVTALYKDKYSGTLKYFDGSILKLDIIAKEESVLISTGDSCMYPHILEVRM